MAKKDVVDVVERTSVELERALLEVAELSDELKGARRALKEAQRARVRALMGVGDPRQVDSGL